MPEDEPREWIDISFEIKTIVEELDVGCETFYDAKVTINGRDTFLIDKKMNIRNYVKDIMTARGVNVIDIRITKIEGDKDYQIYVN